jgi:hypothetical protein
VVVSVMGGVVSGPDGSKVQAGGSVACVACYQQKWCVSAVCRCIPKLQQKGGEVMDASLGIRSACNMHKQLCCGCLCQHVHRPHPCCHLVGVALQQGFVVVLCDIGWCDIYIQSRSIRLNYTYGGSRARAIHYTKSTAVAWLALFVVHVHLLTCAGVMHLH